MADYTEFFFRAHLKGDTPAGLVDWLDDAANNLDGPRPEPFDDSKFFTENNRWDEIFYPGGAVYQISRNFQFTRGDTIRNHELIILSSSKGHYNNEYLLEWLQPWLAHSPGDFLGWTLSEYSRPRDNDGWGWGGRETEPEPDREQPTLIFMPSPNENPKAAGDGLHLPWTGQWEPVEVPATAAENGEQRC